MVKNFRISGSVWVKSFFLALGLTFINFSGCLSTYNERPLSSDSLISTNNIKANLEFLTSDELEGREATTTGEKLAAIFIASELKKYGVNPYYENYLQDYDLFSISAKPESRVEVIKSSGDKITLNYYDGFIADRRSSITTMGKYKVVFAGFGIYAPEFNYNDYENLNVTGKIVIVADDEPFSADTSYFEGQKKSKYSKESTKVSTAKNLGAIGLITIPSEYYLKNWERIRTLAKGEAVSLSGKEREKLLNLIFNEESLSLLFENEKYSFPEIKNQLVDHKPLTSFVLEKEIEVDVILDDAIKKSYNVVGIIVGKDSLFKNEYVAIGAHYDHVGVIDGIVYNGADDNGSGTVALLEVARAFANAKDNKRSILVVFHGAEEKGLLGSEYFTENFDNINNIIAHINMDMVGREHIDTLYSVGSARLSSEFHNLVEEVNSETVNFIFNYKFDDPSDRQRIYYRSDHYNYAKYNIPIVFFYDYMREDYHKHTDDVEKINFDKIKKTAVLVYKIASRTANLNMKPKIDIVETLQLVN